MQRIILIIILYAVAAGLSIAALIQTDWVGKPGVMYVWGHYFHVIASLSLPVVLFAIATALLMAHRRAVQQARVTRGLCRICCYDLRAHDDATTCPECGRGIIRRPRT